MKFLTEPEVAEILRCSTSKIKRLRLGGKLAYIPGRPVLISETDLNGYLASQKRNVEPPPPPEPMTPEEEHAAMVKNAREWALKIKHKIPRIKRSKTPT
ncbi:MAG: helix-turn-helix domain-containing protein [Paracoccus sp. (in: a-proteobacteria)]|uniref:helix-turn-helix domain-containing protein n=1 Tax=Paracoccus sp. TaxID=267 RepID=UPI003241EAB4